MALKPAVIAVLMKPKRRPSMYEDWPFDDPVQAEDTPPAAADAAAASAQSTVPAQKR